MLRAAVARARARTTPSALEINSIGDADERRAHRAALVDYFTQHTRARSTPTRERRLDTNPLRILDSKNPALQDDHRAARRGSSIAWSRRRARTSTALQALLDEAGIAFTINPRLVRGLDYYNRTVFEWITDRLGAQGTVAGGGRYDGLFEQLGGKPTPACGFAMGIERMILLLQESRQRQRAPRRSPTSCTRVTRPRGSRGASPRRCATPGTSPWFTPAAAASSRR